MKVILISYAGLARFQPVQNTTHSRTDTKTHPPRAKHLGYKGARVVAGFMLLVFSLFGFLAGRGGGREGGTFCTSSTAEEGAAGLPPRPPSRCPFTRSRRAEPRCPRAHRPEEERSRAGCSAPLRAGRAPAPALPRAAQRRALRLLTVLLLGAGEGELAAEVGLGDGPLPPAGQGRCQQEQPEEEHWAGGARGSGTAGTGGAAPRPGRLSAAPGAGCAAGEKAALSLLWQRRIAG